MKKTLVRKKKSTKRDALRPEYRFDYSKSKPNIKLASGTVSEGGYNIFNALLRSVISAMPSSKRNQAG
ncbi:MAG: hypothetical protein DMG11_11175 [Acidobacteria bacterium]|nr:MAG: hypothetical protein DMG11_11175 [Acidobacteriota bacterium]